MNLLNDLDTIFIKQDNEFPEKIGIKKIDEKINFYKGQHNVIVAGTGSGKTSVLVNFAYSNYMIGKNVLIITTELTEKEITNRFLSCLTEVELSKIENSKLSKKEIKETKEKILFLEKEIKGNLDVLYFPPKEITFKKIIEKTENLEKKPDVILIDQLSTLDLSCYHKDDLYHQYSSLCSEIKSYAVKNQIIIFSAAQSSSTKKITESTIEGGKSIGRYADLIFVLTNSQSYDKAYIDFLKVRKGKKPLETIVLDRDTNTLKFR